VLAHTHTGAHTSGHPGLAEITMLRTRWRCRCRCRWHPCGCSVKREEKLWRSLKQQHRAHAHTRRLTHTLTAWENKKRKMYKPKRSKSVAAKVERGKRQATQVKSS